MGEEICWPSFPFVDPPLFPPASNFFPVRTAPEVLPNMATPAGFLCSLSCFLPLPTFPSSLHTSSPGEAGQVQMTPEAGQDSEVWWHSRKDTQLPEPVFAKCWRLALPSWPDQARDAAPACLGN